MLALPWIALFAALAPVARHGPGHDDDAQRFVTSRAPRLRLPLPDEQDAFSFVVFGDRTGGPAAGIRVLEQAVGEVNLIRPDLVMTVGDLVQGYNDTPAWLEQASEFKGVMQRLRCPWFPVAGNHDIYWRGRGPKPAGEHEQDFETHFGPLWYAFRHKSSWFVALYSDEGDPATGLKDFNRPECQRIGDEQFRWLADTLERAKGADHVFVFLHHPRWLSERYGEDWERVHALLARAGNVSAVFAGHIHHMRYDGERDGIEYFALATVGGDQTSLAPQAGYLHQYHLVTVRKDELALAAFPVGSAFDPRAVTGRVSDDCARVAQELRPRFEGALAFDESLAATGDVEIALTNPVRRTLEVELEFESGDSRWRARPDHAHARLEPGATVRLALHASRASGTLDDAYREPRVVVRVDYLGEGLRVPLPERTYGLPLDRRSVPLPPAAAIEHALALDGRGDYLRVAHDQLDLPDGPFTVEGWLCAASFLERQGWINQTEQCEFGLFLDGGTPSFLVHLGGKYVSARADGVRLESGRWHHVAGVFDGREVRLYVDGRRVAARPGSGARTRRALPLLIGADVSSDGSGNSFFRGYVDEVRISLGVRYAAAEFVPARRFQSDAITLLLLHMDADLGPWSADASGRGTHATRLGDAHSESAP